MDCTEYKVAVIGSTGVGKSSLCMQFTRNTYSDIYQPTIQDYYKKHYHLDSQDVIFDIIDTAGQENNLIKLSQLILQARGYILVFDITNKQSFEQIKEFRERILHINHAVAVPMVLVGNKSDLEENRQVSTFVASEQAREWGLRYFDISVKLKSNIDNVFKECARQIRRFYSTRFQGEQNCCCLLF